MRRLQRKLARRGARKQHKKHLNFIQAIRLYLSMPA